MMGRREMTEKDKKRLTKIIIAILSLFCIASWSVNNNTNNGTQYIGDNGTIIVYPPETQLETQPDLKQNITYINNNESIIESEVPLEGILTKFKYSMEKISFNTAFNKDKAVIVFGPDMVGFKLYAVFEDGIGCPLDLNVPEDISFLIYGEEGDIKEDLDVQISTYDFNKDGNNELIVFMRSTEGGVCAVFSYTKVEDKKRNNPFNLELCVETQKLVAVEDSKLIVPIGSQGYINIYKYDEDGFYQLQ